MADRCKNKVSGRDLRTAVTFERLTQTRKSTGGFSRSWAAITGAPTRAKVEHRGGGESIQGDRVQAVKRYRITVRYMDGITEGDRVTIGTETLNIRHVRNVDFANKWLEIDAESGVAA